MRGGSVGFVGPPPSLGFRVKIASFNCFGSVFAIFAFVGGNRDM